MGRNGVEDDHPHEVIRAGCFFVVGSVEKRLTLGQFFLLFLFTDHGRKEPAYEGT